MSRKYDNLQIILLSYKKTNKMSQEYHIKVKQYYIVKQETRKSRSRHPTEIKMYTKQIVHVHSKKLKVNRSKRMYKLLKAKTPLI